jgi:hypothetical protein
VELFPEDVRFQRLHKLRERIESDEFTSKKMEWVSAALHVDPFE